MTVPVPEWLAEHARRFYAEGREPVPPRRAATVLLLRDAAPGVEVYLIRRAASMAFASGMCAFPGGAVDPRDASHAVRWTGPSPADWALRLGLEDESASRAMVCAAVRETFEESGVLLAGVADTSVGASAHDASAGASAHEAVVGDVSGPEWERARQALVDRDLAFSDLLEQRGLALRSDLLAAWARWITPEFEPRRYDTCFFLAALPEAQRTRDVSSEADSVAWVNPAEAMDRFSRGEMAMLPPTAVTLSQLAEYSSVAEALRAAAGRDLTPVMPRVVFNDGAASLTWR